MLQLRPHVWAFILKACRTEDLEGIDAAIAFLKFLLAMPGLQDPLYSPQQCKVVNWFVEDWTACREAIQQVNGADEEHQDVAVNRLLHAYESLQKRIFKETRQRSSGQHYPEKVAEFISNFAEWVRDGGFTAKCVEVITRGGLLVVESQISQLEEEVDNLSLYAGGYPSERAMSHWSDEFQDEIPTMTLEALMEGPGATLLEFAGPKLVSAKQKTQKALDKMKGTLEKLKAHSSTAFEKVALTELVVGACY